MGLPCNLGEVLRKSKVDPPLGPLAVIDTLLHVVGVFLQTYSGFPALAA